ncbi:hypothetical protein ACIQMZ_37165 [Streptomyces longwoodensis]|uniref:hypothetical protein n=1 Tax=Streptomyces longwoodensis TaxID=68231 RepID=UPI0038309D27
MTGRPVVDAMGDQFRGSLAAALLGKGGGTVPGPTFCESCRRAEMTRWERLREDVLTALRGPDAARFVRLHGATLYAAYIGRTPYDRHRQEYERTGDPIELERMLRHVTAGAW